MLDFNKTINSLPPEYAESLTEYNRKAFLSGDISIIVLDDDPTGTQTIFDVPVLTNWDEPVISKELKYGTNLFFILTNSRSLHAAEANKLALEIGQNIKKASEEIGRKVMVISRGDSTLRGHYPNEVDWLGKGLGFPDAPQILIPAFFQGGRYTLNDIHYVRDGDILIPAAETPFAKDSTFGYISSNLKEYVEEKSRGRFKAIDVISVGINDIREYGPKRVTSILNKLQPGQVCIVNAASQKDLDVFTAGFYSSEKMENPVLFRTAASIVPSLAGVSLKPPLEKSDLSLTGNGGVIAVGSYVPITSKQLDFLKNDFPTEYIEIQASELLNAATFENEILRVSKRINAILEKNQVVVIYTSRKLIKGNNADESLRIVNRISSGMVEIVKEIKVRPRFFIAKGGITSSDIVTKSLRVKKAQVLGQIIPGVPLWQLNDCVPFPGLIYMPFPGNLGGEDAILKAVIKLV